MMAMKALWRKVEPILWVLASVYLFLVGYGVLLYPAKFWAGPSWGPLGPFWGRLFVLVVVGFWWTGFKSRLAKFLRESLREMIVEELAESRVAFVTWLREDAPWRGENPFSPGP
jgi:hypothetical protein